MIVNISIFDVKIIVDLIKQLIQAENNKALQLNFVSYSRWWGEKKYWRNTFALTVVHILIRGVE